MRMAGQIAPPIFSFRLRRKEKTGRARSKREKPLGRELDRRSSFAIYESCSRPVWVEPWKSLPARAGPLRRRSLGPRGETADGNYWEVNARSSLLFPRFRAALVRVLDLLRAEVGAVIVQQGEA